GIPIGEILVQMGALTEDVLVEFLGKQFNIPYIAKKILSKSFNPKPSKRYKSLLPLIKLLRKHFKKFNLFEVRDSIKRLLIKDKKILQSPFFVHYEKQKKKPLIVALTIFGLISIAALFFLFISTNRYHEWIVPNEYGKVILEFQRANLDPDNIFIGIDGKYEKAVFKTSYDGFHLIPKKINKSKFLKAAIQKTFNKTYYLPKGEHDFSIVSGSYKNLKKVIVSSRTMQRKNKKTRKGQEVNIPISDLWAQEVTVYFRFWDSISNKLLFIFDHYSDRKINKVKNEEDELKIFFNKKYIKLKDYILQRKKDNFNPFISNKKYYLMVEGFKSRGYLYNTKKFVVKFALDDRTLIIHTPLSPKPCKIIINSDVKNPPIIINKEKNGYIFKKDSYEYMSYKKIEGKLIKGKKYKKELLIPPGWISIRISKKGKKINKKLKSGENLVVNVKKENGKYIY
ncbi:MAG: hypothetical protein KAT05_09605, partial [Spirochaetes bacterium]|nr:hypothetical protein [Spirochaetota bacterium]